MLTPGLMGNMTDAHLIVSVEAEFNPLTATDLEIELLRRLEAYTDEYEANAALFLTAYEYELDADDLEKLGSACAGEVDKAVALLDILYRAEIFDPELLKADLKLADQLRTLAAVAGDTFTRLSQLTQEIEA